MALTTNAAFYTGSRLQQARLERADFLAPKSFVAMLNSSVTSNYVHVAFILSYYFFASFKTASEP